MNPLELIISLVQDEEQTVAEERGFALEERLENSRFRSDLMSVAISVTRLQHQP